MTNHAVIALNNTDAVRLTPEGTHSGLDITVQNLSETEYVYVGGEGVTTSDFGHRLIPLSAIGFELPGKNALYAVSSGTSSVAILSTSLEIGY